MLVKKLRNALTPLFNQDRFSPLEEPLTKFFEKYLKRRTKVFIDNGIPELVKIIHEHASAIKETGMNVLRDKFVTLLFSVSERPSLIEERILHLLEADDTDSPLYKIELTLLQAYALRLVMRSALESGTRADIKRDLTVKLTGIRQDLYVYEARKMLFEVEGLPAHWLQLGDELGPRSDDLNLSLNSVMVSPTPDSLSEGSTLSVNELEDSNSKFNGTLQERNDEIEAPKKQICLLEGNNRTNDAQVQTDERHNVGESAFSLANDTLQLLEEFKQTVDTLDSLKLENSKLNEQVSSLSLEIKALKRNIKREIDRRESLLVENEELNSLTETKVTHYRDLMVYVAELQGVIRQLNINNKALVSRNNYLEPALIAENHVRVALQNDYLLLYHSQFTRTAKLYVALKNRNETNNGLFTKNLYLLVGINLLHSELWNKKRELGELSDENAKLQRNLLLLNRRAQDLTKSLRQETSRLEDVNLKLMYGYEAEIIKLRDEIGEANESTHVERLKTLAVHKELAQTDDSLSICKAFNFLLLVIIGAGIFFWLLSKVFNQTTTSYSPTVFTDFSPVPGNKEVEYCQATWQSISDLYTPSTPALTDAPFTNGALAVINSVAEKTGETAQCIGVFCNAWVVSAVEVLATGFEGAAQGLRHLAPPRK